MSATPGLHDVAGRGLSPVVDSDEPIDRIDHQPAGRSGEASPERAVPYHCPYCAEEDLRPVGDTPGAWHCRSCTRTFSVRYLGMQGPSPTWRPSTTQATTRPTGATP